MEVTGGCCFAHHMAEPVNSSKIWSKSPGTLAKSFIIERIQTNRVYVYACVFVFYPNFCSITDRVDSRESYGLWPRKVNEPIKQVKRRLREEGRVHLIQITWNTCSQVCFTLQAWKVIQEQPVQMYESRPLSAPCRSELCFLLTAK